MRKLICIGIILTLLGMAGCAFGQPKDKEVLQPQPETSVGETQAESPGEIVEAAAPKVGIIIGPNAQSEELYSIEKLKAIYGDFIVSEICPSNVEQNPEALASCALSLAEQGVEAIVFVHAVKGTCNAIDKVREAYPYMFIVCGSAEEEPEIIASKADMVLDTNKQEVGANIVEQAAKMGAKTFVLYTFPRHMADETLSGMRDSFNMVCAENGMQFVDATAPDPQSEVGEDEAVLFIVDDVPRMVARYGKETAFFSTSCELQEALIRTILQEGALYPRQCHPSPLHAYPSAFKIDIPKENQGDASYIIEQIHETIKTRGGHGRFSTWPVSMDSLITEVGAEYSIAYLTGVITERNDAEALGLMCSEISGDEEVNISNHKAPIGDGILNNYYLILLNYVNF